MGAEQERRMDLEELDRELDCSLVVGQEETMDELRAHRILGLGNDLRVLLCEAANDPLELGHFVVI